MTLRPLVVIPDYLAECQLEQSILADLADVVALGAKDAKEVFSRAPHAAVLLLYHEITIDRNAIEALDRCLGIVRCGVGYDNVDIQAAGQAGIVVCNVPDYGTEEVADHALLMLLAVARRLIPQDRAIRNGVWEVKGIFGAPRLRGRTLGIVGCGRIGSAMALRAKALGMRVVIHDPYQPDGVEKSLGIERTSTLELLLPQAEFLSLHCPLTAETHKLLSDRTLDLLPRGVYVVNTARGGCIDTLALYRALESGQVAGAGLDVLEKEPLDCEELRRHPRVVLTPHTAFYSVEGFQEMREKGAREARRLLLGEPVRNPVNREFLIMRRAKA